MGKQILATVVLDNTNGQQTIPVSFLSDLIYIKEVQNDDNINSAIYFYGNPNSGLVPKPYVYMAEETVSELVSDSSNSLVLCNVLAIDGNGNRLTSLEYAFPTAGFQITESNFTGANAAILYRGYTYDVEEEMDDLISDANAGGGGGGGDTLFALTGTNIATGDVTGALLGDNLSVIGDEGFVFLNINSQDVEVTIGGSVFAPNIVDGTEFDDAVVYDSGTGQFGTVPKDVVFPTLQAVTEFGNETTLPLLSETSIQVVSPIADPVRIGLGNSTGATLYIDISDAGVPSFEITNVDGDLIQLNFTGIDANRSISFPNFSGTLAIVATGETAFNGTLADAISGAKSVVNGIIID